MRQYKLTLDKQPSWTSLWIHAADDAEAVRRAAQIVAPYGSEQSFSLTRSGQSIPIPARTETQAAQR